MARMISTRPPQTIHSIKRLGLFMNASMLSSPEQIVNLGTKRIDTSLQETGGVQLCATMRRTGPLLVTDWRGAGALGFGRLLRQPLVVIGLRNDVQRGEHPVMRDAAELGATDFVFALFDRREPGRHTQARRGVLADAHRAEGI